MSEKIRDMRIPDFLELAASDAPAPGGGAVAALCAAIGASLGQMVLNLSYGKKFWKNYDKETVERLEGHEETLKELQKKFMNLMDEDADAFMGFMAALKLPKTTDEEKAERKKAMQAAAIESMQVPLDTAECCVKMAECLPDIARYGNGNAVTDAGVASLLARAACEGAIFNVRINLGSIKDEKVVADAEKICDELMEKINKLNEETVGIVYERI